MQLENIDGFRLSPQQKHLWARHANAAAGTFTAKCLVELTGKLDRERLQASTQKLVEHYEILRTNFKIMPGISAPMQVIQAASEVNLDFTDLSGFSEKEQAVQINTLFNEAVSFEIDDTPAKLFSLHLLKINDARHLLCLSLPTLWGDAASLSLMTRELSEIYSGVDTGGNGEETMQFADVAEWLNELLESEDAEQGVLFWKELNFRDLVNSPMAFRKRNVENLPFDPKLYEVALEGDSAERIFAFCEKEEISLNAFFLACWQIQLAQLNGAMDFFIGNASDGRTYEELQGSIGPLTKYTPFGCQFSAELLFMDLLGQTVDKLAEGSEWQEYFSWEKIFEEEDNIPYFPVAFSCNTVENDSADNTHFTVLAQRVILDRFDIQLSVSAQGQKLAVFFEFDNAKFDRENVAIFSAQLTTLIDNVLENPTAHVGSLCMLSASAQELILNDFSGAKVSPVENASQLIHEMLLKQVALKPNATAVRFQEKSLTYAELDSRSNQLANYLQKQAVSPGDFVGLLVEPSIEAIVGIWGIIKVGAAYVPLDPNYPEKRLSAALEDISASVVCTLQHLEGKISGSVKRVFLDNLSEIGMESAAAPDCKIKPDNYVYAIYTSGSTGKPKGVAIQHANLCHSTSARFQYYQSPVEKFLLLSSFAFDSSMVGLFWTLTSGGELILADQESQRDPQEVKGLIAKNGATHTLCLPSLYSLLLDEPKKIDSLKTVIVAGEACPSEIVARHLSNLPQCRLFNEYGPTEGTVWSTVYDCADYKKHFPMFIGKPVPGAKTYIVRPNGTAAPVGIAGELCIGGPGMALGYLNRPETTAQAFVKNTLNGNDGKLYKTGDSARFWPDGNIEFLGRIDHQVKIRGHRIELEEIGSLLRGNPAVAEEVVVAKNIGGESVEVDNKQLIAYVKPADNGEVDARALQQYLQKSLPDYMIPAFFVGMDDFPRTPNGKIDRNALPDPFEARVGSMEDYVAPENAVEEVMGGILTDLLNLERIGINDNIFDLGGHSIMVAQFAARIRDSLELELSLRTIFDKPTVRLIAEHFKDGETNWDALEKRATLVQKVASMSSDEMDAIL